MKLPALDKIYHAVVSYAAVLTFVHLMPLLYAVILTLVVGALKEWYDYTKPLSHTADWNDFWADCVGVGAAAAVVLLAVQYNIFFHM